jgi:hypothetical protein
VPWSEPSDYSINPGIILQFNATIIVGVLIFLTFSQNYFGSNPPNPELQNSTNQTSMNTISEDDLSLQVAIVLSLIIPFAYSSIMILEIYHKEVKDGKKYRGRLLMVAAGSSSFGVGYIVLIMVVLYFIQKL